MSSSPSSAMLAWNQGGRVLKRRPSVARSKRTPSRELRSPMCEQPNRRTFRPFSTPKIASLRATILDHLTDLENSLSQLESPLRKLKEENDVGSTKRSSQVPLQRSRSGSLSASAVEEAYAHIRDGLEMLNHIRADVCSHLPDFSGLDFLPDFSLDDVRSHIPSFEFPELDLHLPSTPFSPSLENLNLDPLSYLPTLKTHLDSLHDHLVSVKLPSSLSLNFPAPSPNGRMSELLHKLQDPDLFTDPLKSPLDFLGDSRRPFSFDPADLQRNSQTQIHEALAKSLHGERLIGFSDLPQRYQNDEFVLTGYRFIPLNRWPRLLLSIFQFHNETANIWTHMLPFLVSLTTLSASITPVFRSIQPSSSFQIDFAETIFSFLANICLLSSCVWHIMAGCAHQGAMEAAARVDYVGIGWLISASIGSVVYYGFGCRPQTAAIYLSVSFALGVAGSILPFMSWFNDRESKKWRILFFLSLVFTLIFPLAHLAAVHSLGEMYKFFRNEIPSLATYAAGLLFYAFHFPECAIPTKWNKYTDWVGGGSHAIWHLFIVLAIKLHKDAMVQYRGGIGDEMCTLSWGNSDGLFDIKSPFTGISLGR